MILIYISYFYDFNSVNYFFQVLMLQKIENIIIVNIFINIINDLF